MVSLFTRVPINDLLDFLLEELNSYEFCIPNNVIVKLISLCVVNCKFTFNNEFYEQHFGMAMGNPLSPLLSGLYMEFFERAHLPSLNLEWSRYVDDCICIIPSEKDVSLILDFLK